MKTNLPFLSLNQEQLSVFDDAIQKEWLITNGLGSYASSTVLGLNTRKYHGLLVAALHPPGDRTVCLAKIDEEVNVGGRVYLLGANEFIDAVFPRGYMHLNSFSVSPFPKYVYNLQDIEVQKTIFMQHEKNVTIAAYKVLNGNSHEVKFKLSPLVTCRHFHTVINRRDNLLGFTQGQSSRAVQLSYNDHKAMVTVRATDGEFHEKPNWIERLYYREEASRGESAIDDSYEPGTFELTIPSNTEEKFAIIAAVTEDRKKNTETLDAINISMSEVNNTLIREVEQRRNLLAKFYRSNPDVLTKDWLNWILLAAENFIVKGAKNQRSVIAGYQWFESWGRDAFISLPGLMLVTRKFKDAENVLSNFNAYCKHGLIPNFLDDKSGTASYNAVDATLWYINAVLQFLKYTGNFNFVHSRLWENLKAIIKSHMEGTDYGIHMDNDYLLSHGGRLTWMDTEIDGKAVTSRAGKAVEIQALWYNALRTMQLLGGRFGDRDLAEDYAAIADKTKVSFNEKFWNGERNCLFDALDQSRPDEFLRPNQIIAVSLDFTMLNREMNTKILDIVQHELLTPCGLRTLERNNPHYRNIYLGDRRRRDEAYHNGTVWPWLLGPFITAFLKTKGYTLQNREYALKIFVEPLFERQVSVAGLGMVNEVFDGDEPNMPRGCIAQAWSVAEPLRAYVEDVLQIRPRFEKSISCLTQNVF